MRRIVRNYSNQQFYGRRRKKRPFRFRERVFLMGVFMIWFPILHWNIAI